VLAPPSRNAALLERARYSARVTFRSTQIFVIAALNSGVGPGRSARIDPIALATAPAVITAPISHFIPLLSEENQSNGPRPPWVEVDPPGETRSVARRVASTRVF